MMKKALIALVALLTQAAFATDSFDASTNELTVPMLQIGNTVYSNLVVKLKDFSIESAGSSQTLNSASAPSCTAANFTSQAYDQVSLGMTIDQAVAAMGCRLDFGIDQWVMTGGTGFYYWHVPGNNPIDPNNPAPLYVLTYFERGFVAQPNNGYLFKYRAGF
jgi:hypothetical protein